MKQQKMRYTDMINELGYDYVIGYCLGSAYNISKKASYEKDAEKKEKMLRLAKKFERDADNVAKERIDSGL